MISLNALDWTDTPGKGLVALVHVAHLVNGPIRELAQIPITIGDRVRIDGDEYFVKGIEVSTTMVYPPLIRPEVGLAVRKVTVEVGDVPDMDDMEAFIKRMIGERRAEGDMAEVDRLLDMLNDLNGTQSFIEQVIRG